MSSGVKSWSTTAATNASADSTVNFAEGQAPSTLNDSSRAVMAAIASWYAQIAGGMVTTGTVGGTANVITLTCSPTVDALATGQAYLFALGSNTTSTITLQVDSLTAKAVKYRSTALVSGDGAAGDLWLVVYNGTDYELINPPRLSAGAADWTTDTTGGDVADLFVFADASQGNAINKVTAQKMMDNLLAALTAKTTAATADYFMMADSAASNVAKTVTAANLLTVIAALTAKATPTTSDLLVISDAAASNAAKKSTIAQVQAILAAAQANQETATSTALFVTPGVQQYHPSACKAWGQSNSGGTLQGTAYNTASIAKNATGNYTVTFTTAMSSANYSINVTLEGGVQGGLVVTNKLAGSFDILTVNTSNSAADRPFSYQCFGDQ